MMNDEGESTDVEYSDTTLRSVSPRRCGSPHSEEETIDVESVRLAILNLKKLVRRVVSITSLKL